MDANSSQNIQNIDDELKILKEKRKKLEEISSKIKNIKENKKNTNFFKYEKMNNSENNNSALESEKLALTKQEILDFCDRVLEKWETDPTKDNRYIFAMNAVKTSILWTEEDTIKEIWNEIIHWVFELLYKNAIAQGNADNLEWSQIMKKLNNSI